MAGKRVLGCVALLAALAATGCRHWCEERYCPRQAPISYAPPQQPAAAYQPCVCVPCCPGTGPATAAYAQPAAACVPCR